MKEIKFNNSKLSKLSFGTVQLGLNYGISNSNGQPSQDKANKIINYLCDSGINCFDTAVAYGNSEEVLGKALHLTNSVHVISKIKSDVFIESLESTVTESLNKLGLDKLFGLLLHDSDLLFKWNSEYTDKVILLKNKGLIDYFGVSIYTSEEFDIAIANPLIEVIQIPFNLFDQRAINDKWFEKAEQANKLIFIRSIFLQGLFFMNPEELKGNLIEATPYLLEMQSISEKLNLSIAHFMMAYVDSVAPSAILLFGCDTLTQAEENVVSYNNLPLLADELLRTINKKFSNIPMNIINPSQWKIS